MPSIDGFPVPVAGRKITPGSASPGPPQHAVDDQPVIHPPAATPRRPIRQQRLQPHPFPIGQIMTIKHDKVLPAHPLKIHETRPSPAGTHRAPPDRRCAPTKQRPFPPRRLCCPAAQPVLRPPPTPTRPAIHFPVQPVIGRHAPVKQSAGHRAGEGLPSSRRHHRYVPAPHTPGSPSRLRFQALRRFHGLRPDFGGSALPVPALAGETSNDAAGFASCYGPHRRSPLQGFDAGLRRRAFPPGAASLLPGLLAATRTGLPPAGDDELTNTKKHHGITSRCHLLLCWAHE